MKTSPCRFCRERYVGCHSVCEPYLNFQCGNEEIKKNRKKSVEINEYERTRSHRIYKKKRQSGEMK